MRVSDGSGSVVQLVNEDAWERGYALELFMPYGRLNHSHKSRFKDREAPFPVSQMYPTLPWRPVFLTFSIMTVVVPASR